MKRITIYMAVIAMLVFACNSSEQKKDAAATTDQASANREQPQDPGSSPTQNKQTTKTETIPTNKNAYKEDWNKKIIKNAFIRLEVKDYSGFNKSIHENLKNFGAFISEEEQTQGYDQKNNQLTIKVPVHQFEDLINSLSGDSIKLIEKKITSEEVTGEIVDTRSRIEAKKQVREKYLDLLKDAKNMKEVLDVQQEINGVQESIESASGRVKYLTHQSAYSTIHLRYAEYLQPNIPTEDQTGFWTRATNGFNSGVKVIGSFFIFLVTIWPLLLLATIALIIWKKRKINQANP